MYNVVDFTQELLVFGAGQFCIIRYCADCYKTFYSFGPGTINAGYLFRFFDKVLYYALTHFHVPLGWGILRNISIMGFYAAIKEAEAL